MTRLSSIAYVLLLISPCLYPGYFPFDVNLLLAAATSVMLAALVLINFRHLRIPMWPLIFFSIAGTIQVYLFLSGLIPAIGGWKLQFMVYASAMLIFFAGTTTSIISLIRWMQIYVCICLIWLFIGWLVWLGGTSGQAMEFGVFTLSMAPAIKLAGPFNQGNIFATGIGMAWLFAHWLALKNQRWYEWLAVVLLTAAMFDTLSRGGWIAFVPCLTIMIVVFRPLTKRTMVQLFLIWCVGLLLGITAYALSQPASLDEGFLSIAKTAANSIDARLLIWFGAINIFIDHPLTGAGWGQFANQFWLVKPEAMTDMNNILGHVHALPSTVLSAHNLFLQMISEGGSIILFGIIAGFGFLVSRAVTLAKRFSSRMPFTLAALGFLVQAQINVTYSATALFLCASFFAGIGMAPWFRKTSLTFELKTGGRMALIFAVIFIAGYSINLSITWFKTGEVIEKMDVADKSSLQPLITLTDRPRVRAIPLAWLTYQIAIEGKHPSLLYWIAPMLSESALEIPFVDLYQVKFYALANTDQPKKACEIGKLIASQKLPGEKNNAQYSKICSGQKISSYQFGH